MNCRAILASPSGRNAATNIQADLAVDAKRGRHAGNDVRVRRVVFLRRGQKVVERGGGHSKESIRRITFVVIPAATSECEVFPILQNHSCRMGG